MAFIGIDAHSLSERRTGIGMYVAELIAALGRIAPEEAIRLYLHSEPGERLPFESCLVPRTPGWTTVRLSLHFAFHPKPRVMLFPSHSMPLLGSPPSVVTILDLAFERFPGHFTHKDRFRLQRTTRFSVERADHLIAISESTRADLVELLGVREEKITVVPLAYDARRFQPASAGEIEAVKRKYDLARPFVLTVGTLQRRKNHAALIRALGLLHQEKLDLDLVVCGGKGWLFDEIFRTVRELKLEDRVRFLGYVPCEDLPALYSGAEASALVSLYEGFGLPILESLACGTPVVVSEVSSMPEVGGPAVLTVDPHAVEEIAAALSRLICDQALRAELSRAAPAQLGRFSWERTAAATLEILRSV